jgi:hypothetical protein
MFDFSSEGTSLSELDTETRLRLANLLTLRGELQEKMWEVNRRKIALLMSPSAAGEQDLAEYNSAVVAPLRARVAEMTTELMNECIDLDKIKSLVPMFLLGMSQAINFPMLFSVLNIDPDHAAELFVKMKEFFSDFKG